MVEDSGEHTEAVGHGDLLEGLVEDLGHGVASLGPSREELR